MLTGYDQYTAEIFDQAGIESCWSATRPPTTSSATRPRLPVTVDELLPLAGPSPAPRGARWWSPTCRSAPTRPSAQQALRHRRPVHEGGPAHAVKIEGGVAYADRSSAMVQAGIPVMAHIGFTPQSEHSLGGYRVQGRGDDAAAADRRRRRAGRRRRVRVLMEMVRPTAAAVDAAVDVPTVGIGAGSDTNGQVLVWQDMAGLRGGKMAKFVKQYADLRTSLSDAAKAYGDDVRSGQFPGPEHSF